MRWEPFGNLSWRDLWPRREPALWAALVVAVGNVAAQTITGDLGWGQAVETLVTLVVGFVVRGAVSPV